MDKKRRTSGNRAKMRSLRNQENKCPEEKELPDKCDGLATAAGTSS